MPKFKIFHYKDVSYRAESIVEAKDRDTAESMAHDIPMDEWNELDWEDIDYEEPNWDALHAEEITDG
tara:strand:+ start:1136 stop:1336 length:201 start_codon:yes stop_codon:yes gene_type:complete